MSNKVLVVVDMQEDFVYGALRNDDAINIVGSVVNKVRQFEGEVVFTMDTHSKNYLDTQEGKRLPVEHCIRDTKGWQLIEPLRDFQLEKGCRIFEKETFGCKALVSWLSSLKSSDTYENEASVIVCSNAYEYEASGMASRDVYECESSAMAGSDVYECETSEIAGSNAYEYETSGMVGSNDSENQASNMAGGSLAGNDAYKCENDGLRDVIDEIELIGVCTDICVISNALLLKTFFPEVTIKVDAACCAGINHESHEMALKAMQMCQIEIYNIDF